MNKILKAIKNDEFGFELKHCDGWSSAESHFVGWEIRQIQVARFLLMVSEV